jgi:hypothetical protein
MKACVWPPAGWGVDALLRRYPGLRIRPSRSTGILVISGDLAFDARDDRGERQIHDVFHIELRVPSRFPAELPDVRELGGRVPPDHHVNSNGTLCLGATLRLHLHLASAPHLVGFVESCVVPFLYGCVLKERGLPLPFGELPHGERGLLDDCAEIVGVRGDDACLGMLQLLAAKKRIANKRPCPCRSGRRVGRCHHELLNTIRCRMPRSRFATCHRELESIATTKRLIAFVAARHDRPRSPRHRTSVR